MVRPVLQIDDYVPKTGRKKGEYLTFTFFERDHGMELEIAGWTKLRPQPDKPAYIRGVVNRWGREIPIVDVKVLYGKGPTLMTDSACIVILEHPNPRTCYFGLVVEELSSMVNVVDGTENQMSSLLASARQHLSVHPAVKN